jgi:hypothetical protein
MWDSFTVRMPRHYVLRFVLFAVKAVATVVHMKMGLGGP